MLESVQTALAYLLSPFFGSSASPANAQSLREFTEAQQQELKNQVANCFKGLSYIDARNVAESSRLLEELKQLALVTKKSIEINVGDGRKVGITYKSGKILNVWCG